MKIPFRRERRRSTRSGLDLAVTYRIYLPSCPEIASAFLPARLYDVSHGGLALLTDAIHSNSLHMFHPTATSAEQCLLEIRIPNGHKELTLQGRVVWYDRIDTEGPFVFQVGIEVLDHPRDLRKQIETSIQETPSASHPMEM
jgi:Tfp pilus assembly protein PilZ